MFKNSKWENGRRSETNVQSVAKLEYKVKIWNEIMKCLRKEREKSLLFFLKPNFFLIMIDCNVHHQQKLTLLYAAEQNAKTYQKHQNKTIALTFSKSKYFSFFIMF